MLLPESFDDIQLSDGIDVKQAKKIVSEIVTEQVIAVHKERSAKELKGAPATYISVRREYVNIHSDELRRIPKYKEIIRELEEKRIIEVNNHYSNYEGNKFPKSYRLHIDHWDECLVLSTVKQRTSKRKHKERRGFFTNAHEAAANFIDCFDLPEEFVQEYERICNKAKWPDLAKARIVNLNKQLWWDTVDHSGRYHHPLTQLDKNIRLFLLCNGTGIVGFDYANFQPALLDHIPTAIVIPQQERQHYRSLCGEGTLYEFLFDHSTYSTIAATKEVFLEMLNKENDKMRKMNVWKIFDHFFPTYSQIIQEVKDDDHKNMAKYLHTKEAEIVFGCVVNLFTKITNGHIPFFTVHDAVYTLTFAKDSLRRAMEQAITTHEISTYIKPERVDHQSILLPTYVSMEQNNLHINI